ncbi:MAG: hypothetical protein ACI4GW_03680 [Lachnospiraceae bacterium]
MKKIAPFLVLLAGILWGTIGFFVYHEMITINEMIGVALVIGSIILQKEK